MSTTAFMFPGQGSQEIGMARDLFKEDADFKKFIEIGSEVTHEDLARLCLKGPQKKLIKARYLQPILAAVSLGYLKHVKQAGITAHYVLGHSLGEIIALGASGVISFEDTIVMAAKRGEFMDAAASKCNGGMMAVLFVPIEKVRELLADMHDEAHIALGNDNAPNQVILTGEVPAFDRFAAQLNAVRLGKCQKLQVSGPWHSQCMVEARHLFENWVESIPFDTPSPPMILNATGKETTDPIDIKYRITWQITSPVYWRQCMVRCRELGVDTLLEIGPGRVLAGLARVNGYKRGCNVFSVNNLRGVEKAATAFSQG
ncbi:MAG: acyltransferase domain-containing protein [Chitinivibrionales bacterium]|nr:acyltransferase domain-containing protein [Chitinivibrionales bacterium]